MCIHKRKDHPLSASVKNVVGVVMVAAIIFFLIIIFWS